MTWYAVRDSSEKDDGQVWTVSPHPFKLGWDNDSDCEGYGLTRAEAEFLALAANEKEARDGVKGPWATPRSRISDWDSLDGAR